MNKMYVMTYPDGGYVAIDQSSGGYPWNVEKQLASAKIWTGDGPNGLEHALKYLKSCASDNFTLQELTVTLTPVKIEASKPVLTDVQHATLVKDLIKETDRAVQQALRNERSGLKTPDGGTYETVFSYLLHQHFDKVK